MAGEMWGLTETPLGRAIVEGDPYNVRRLLEKGENVHLKDRKGNTYLHYICTMYKPYVFNVLCAFGVPVNAQNVHGNTALHVSALHNECCHVPDLMQCGCHPNITNKDGKTAKELAKNNPRWLDLFSKYEPSLMLAIKEHDISAITRLFESWSAVHLPIDIQNGFNMRHYSAALTYHDIVARMDKIRFSLMAVFAIKECDYKSLEYALSRGRAICDVNYLHKVQGHTPHHMLQHAIRLNDVTMVTMLLEAGADVNTRVLVNEYITGPLFFEVLCSNNKLDYEIIRKVLLSDIDVDARDERGRTALIYSVDRRRGSEVTTDIIQLLLDRGVNIALRDDTGCTARDVALFARRFDIIECIDGFLVEVIRQSDLSALNTLAVNGYTDIFIEHMVRDSWIYAAGNDTDEVTRFLESVKEYWATAQALHKGIREGSYDKVEELLQNNSRDQLLCYRDKSGRGVLMTAVMWGHNEIATSLATVAPDTVQQERDNIGRTVLHYIEALPEDVRDSFKALPGLDVLQHNLDVRGVSPEQMSKFYPNFIIEERNKSYGLGTEVDCLQKYDQLMCIIRSEYKGLKHFDEVLRFVGYPVSCLPALFSPGGHLLVSEYRDLLMCALDHHKDDIARRLVQLYADCTATARCQGDNKAVLMDAVERAEVLGMASLASYIRTKCPTSAT